jgi:hypothetical protein
MTDTEKVKRIFALKIDNYSASELEIMLSKHINKTAIVTTDKWKDCLTVSKHYNITYIIRNKRNEFQNITTIIYQAKSGIRTTYSSVSVFNILRTA